MPHRESELTLRGRWSRVGGRGRRLWDPNTVNTVPETHDRGRRFPTRNTAMPPVRGWGENKSLSSTLGQQRRPSTTSGIGSVPSEENRIENQHLVASMVVSTDTAVKRPIALQERSSRELRHRTSPNRKLTRSPGPSYAPNPWDFNQNRPNVIRQLPRPRA